MIPEHFV